MSHVCHGSAYFGLITLIYPLVNAHRIVERLIDIIKPLELVIPKDF
jgi:hypothetical protein